MAARVLLDLDLHVGQIGRQRRYGVHGHGATRLAKFISDF
jgi:hypothetical protein